MEQWVEDKIQAGRKLFFNAAAETPEGYLTDQELRKPQPPLAKAPMTDNILDLSKDFRDLDIENDFLQIINTRKSHRVYTDQPISLKALSYLLSTVNQRKIVTRQKRTVTQAWKHAEIHEHGQVLKRLAWGFPHGCMAGISIETA